MDRHAMQSEVGYLLGLWKGQKKKRRAERGRERGEKERRQRQKLPL